MPLLSRVSSRSSLSGDKLKCTIHLLDDAETIPYEFQKNATGQDVLDFVCNALNLVEKDYFGVRYMDNLKQRYWLDPVKPILHQIKGISPIVLGFRVKFYPSDPDIVQEEITRYFIFLQLRRDLLHGRLYCSQKEAAFLGAYVLQSEIGDYHPELNKDEYVSEFKLMLKQTPKVESEIATVHKTLREMTAADAELNFLRRACNLDTYGYDPFSVKDAKTGLQVYVGATYQGFMVYQTYSKQYHVKWEDVSKIDYSGKDLMIITKVDATFLPKCSDSFELATNDQGNQTVLLEQQNSVAENSSHPEPAFVPSSTAVTKLHYRCPSAAFCKHLWKYVLEQRAFFTAPKATDVKPQTSRRHIFKRTSTFRYRAPRVLNEIKNMDLPKREQEPPFKRAHIERQPSRSQRDFVSSAAATQTDAGLVLLSLDTAHHSSVSPDAELHPELPSPTTSIESDAASGSLVYNADSYVSDDNSPMLVQSDSHQARRRLNVKPEANGGVVKGGQSAAATVPRVTFANRQVSREGQPSVMPKRRSSRRRPPSLIGCVGFLFRTVLISLLFAILLTSLVVLLMETRNNNGQGYLDHLAPVQRLRRELYAPTREYVLKQYQRAGGKLLSNDGGGAKSSAGEKSRWF